MSLIAAVTSETLLQETSDRVFYNVIDRPDIKYCDYGLGIHITQDELRNDRASAIRIAFP